MSFRKIAEPLLGEMQARLYPNCTLYLIWHYLNTDQYDYALSEFDHDSDKLGKSKPIVEEVLAKAQAFVDEVSKSDEIL